MGSERSAPTLIPGWSPRRVALLSIGLSCVGAVADASTGHRIILLPFVALGPYCALLSGRWRLTALAALWAVALGVVLSVPDGMWASRRQADFVGSVAVISVVAISVAMVVERNLPRR